MKLNLEQVSREILEVKNYIDNEFKTNYDLEFQMFSQWWGNTSCGFEGWGGCALTKEMTYIVHNSQIAYVFFGGKFAYKVKINEEFLDDLKNRNIKGKMSYKNRYIQW